jgi:uncharacterized protein (TIGR03790 family)
MDGILHRRMLGVLTVICASVSNLQAGGGGLNTVVVVNQASSNSCELGNYFCERRQAPAENVLRITWTGGPITWTSNDFQSVLQIPLQSMLAARQLTNQIDYVVLSMDIPFQTTLPSGANATTAALFYGLKIVGGTDPGVTNSYARSENVFQEARPASAPGVSFLATMITAETLTQAKQLVDHGVDSDGTFPLSPVVLAKSSDPARNIRHPLFDNAIFNVDILGVSSILRTNTDSLLERTGLMGFQTGEDEYSLSPGTFVPGAMADSLTSFGGIIFGPNSQTNLLACINAGAAGSYGTVNEPGTDTQKFPDPQVYFYQARGFSLAECIYQSIPAPFLGLTVAEPLAAPFARSGSGGWDTNLANSVLSGSAPLSLRFTAPPGNRLQQVDLFVDGKYHSTLTNVAPAAGNRLDLTLNGYPITCTVGSNATVGAVAAALASAINSTAATNATRVTAAAHGDRLELRSSGNNDSSPPFYVTDTISSNTFSAYRVRYLPDSAAPNMNPLGPDKSGAFVMQVEVPTAMPYVIEASTNLANWEPIFTTSAPGLLDFRDPCATNYPARFYRMVWPSPNQRPKLSPLPGAGEIRMRMESVPGQPCAIIASTNLVDWTPLWTNQAGGAVDFIDPAASSLASRFYRAWLAPPAPPAYTVLTGMGSNALVRIDNAQRPYTVEVSTNFTPWQLLSTNFGISDIQTVCHSAAGSAPVLSTFLTASQSRFRASPASGRQSFVVIAGTPPPGAWLEFTITTTNNSYVSVAVTNLSGTASSAELASNLCALINSDPVLQSSAGLIAEDFVVDQGGTATFNLRARSPGFKAAGIKVQAKRYGLIVLPSSKVSLMQNLSDLQLRNHLYVGAGSEHLDLTFPLDTTALADGYHDLTLVAYEGSHVRTQTRSTATVRIQNTPLNATLNLVDLADTVPVQGTYHIQVAANSTNVSAITLFSTGGALETITNQFNALFQIQGTNLWAGLHPFHALVETASGLKYRTETKWTRLVNNP